jgi:hypothetical protein
MGLFLDQVFVCVCISLIVIYDHMSFCQLNRFNIENFLGWWMHGEKYILTRIIVQ